MLSFVKMQFIGGGVVNEASVRASMRRRLAAELRLLYYETRNLPPELRRRIRSHWYRLSAVAIRAARRQPVRGRGRGRGRY